MPEVLIDNLYVVKDDNSGTISTMLAPFAPDNQSLRISLLTDLDLNSRELRFDFVISDN